MARLLDTYTLTELCNELGLSRAWVSNVEDDFKFKDGPSGRRGEKSSYSRSQFQTFRRTNILRSVKFSMEEIKGFRDLESKIVGILSKKDFPEDKTGKIKFFKPYLYLAEFMTVDGEEYDYDQYQKDLKNKDAAAVALTELFQQHERYKVKIMNRIAKFAEMLKEEVTELKGEDKKL